MEARPSRIERRTFPRHRKAGGPDRQVEPAAPPERGRLPGRRKTGAPTRKQNMSNATPDTRGAGGGERRRRRSRGGKGRNRNKRQHGNDDNRQNRPEGGSGGHNRNRGERGDRGPRPPRKEYKPAPLTLWQKILKIFGLYKEPVRPPRPARKESVRFEEGPPREVKSNTRNARQGGADAAAPPRERRAPERTEVGSPRIYLGNLSYDTTEEDLKDLFKGVGTVRNVEIVYNRRTHKSKGYGFVDMLNVEEAKRSVEVLHDQFFMGRKLVVSGAKSKEHEEAVEEEVREAREAREARATAKAEAAAVRAQAEAAEAPAETPAPAEVSEEAPAPAAADPTDEQQQQPSA